MSTLAIKGNGLQSKLLWAAVAALGAVSFAIIALTRGEPVNAAWLVIAAVCVYSIAYRFYGLFIANKVLGVNPARQTPAYRHNDALDYVPTNRYVLFGHHFAAIAGAGPLVGPVLAAQMGYLRERSDPRRRRVRGRRPRHDRAVHVDPARRPFARRHGPR